MYNIYLDYNIQYFQYKYKYNSKSPIYFQTKPNFSNFSNTYFPRQTDEAIHPYSSITANKFNYYNIQLFR